MVLYFLWSVSPKNYFSSKHYSEIYSSQPITVHIIYTLQQNILLETPKRQNNLYFIMLNMIINEITMCKCTGNI